MPIKIIKKLTRILYISFFVFLFGLPLFHANTTFASGTTVWTDQTVPGAKPWDAVSSSADGTMLVAAPLGGGDIWTGTGCGSGLCSAWLDQGTGGAGYPGSEQWTSVAMSSDGTKLVAVSQTGTSDIWTAVCTTLPCTTTGDWTWTDQGAGAGAPGSRKWHYVTSSSDGKKLAAVVNNASASDIWTGVCTTDPCTTTGDWTWTDQPVAGGSLWYSIASSADGKMLAATVQTGHIWTGVCTTDPCTTTDDWTWIDQGAGAGQPGQNFWRMISSSADGKKLAVAGQGTGGTGGIWRGICTIDPCTSTSDWTWTNSGVTPFGGAVMTWVAIASSADGTRLIAGEYGGGIWVGDGCDSGNCSSWSLQAAGIVSPGSQDWFSIASSSDGTKVIAASWGITIDLWTGVIPAAPLSSIGVVSINATGLLGQSDYTSGSINAGAGTTVSAGGLNGANSVTVDTVNHRLFVVDSNNNRVLIFNLDTNNNISSTTASYVIGQPDFSSHAAAVTQIGLSNPRGVAYDSAHTILFVTDRTNTSRVMVYDVSPAYLTAHPANMSALSVIGQPDFTSSVYATAKNRFASGAIRGGIVYDSSTKCLFVIDGLQNRVLVFDATHDTDADAMTNADAINVLGQPDFVTATAATTQTGLSGPIGLGLDSDHEMLFVGDASTSIPHANRRVMIFNVADAATPNALNGELATNVLGQPDYTTIRTFAVSQNSTDQSDGLSYDSVRKLLYDVDESSRITVFNVANDNIQDAINGESAIAVMGQPNFTSISTGTTQSRFKSSHGSSFNPLNNSLFVGDTSNHRILEFSFIRITMASLPAGIIDTAYSQTVATTNAQGTQSFSLYSGTLPTGLSLNTSTGAITGTPTVAGTSTFTIEADDTYINGSVFFDRATYSLTVNQLYTLTYTAGDNGIITGTSPQTVVSGSDGTAVTAVPNSGYSFSGWSDTETTNPRIDIAITSDVTVTASFTLIPVVSHGGGVIQPVAPTGLSNSSLDFIINSGAKTTTSPNLSIAMNADPKTVTGYAVSLDPKFTNSVIIPYTSTGVFTLPNISGSHTLYLEYFSSTGNHSASIAHSITLTGGTPALFTSTLRLGSTGADVRQLQIFLNTHGSIVSSTGAGSPGNETTYFGQKTFNALVKYQSANGIKPTSGFFGPITLTFVNGVITRGK